MFKGRFRQIKLFIDGSIRIIKLFVYSISDWSKIPKLLSISIQALREDAKNLIFECKGW